MTTETRNTNGHLWGQPLAIYHPNSKGTGSALQLEPRINRRPGDRANCFFVDLASQKTTAARDGARRIPATFDWEHKLTVKLGFSDVCEILTVLEGRQEHAGGERDGLFHDNGNANTLITFQRDINRKGYYFGLSRKGKGDTQAQRVGIVFSETEATGLRHILQTGLFFVLFHTHLFADPSRGTPRETPALSPA